VYDVGGAELEQQQHAEVETEHRAIERLGWRQHGCEAEAKGQRAEQDV